MSEKPTSMGADGIFEPVHIDRVPAEDFAEGYRKSATMEYWEDQPT